MAPRYRTCRKRKNLREALSLSFRPSLDFRKPVEGGTPERVQNAVSKCADAPERQERHYKHSRQLRPPRRRQIRSRISGLNGPCHLRGETYGREDGQESHQHKNNGRTRKSKRLHIKPPWKWQLAICRLTI